MGFYDDSEDDPPSDYFPYADNDCEGCDEDEERTEFGIAVGLCGKTPDGYCTGAGSEYCEFDCPFNGGLNAS
jgi:hypothetical protein